MLEKVRKISCIVFCLMMLAAVGALKVSGVHADVLTPYTPGLGFELSVEYSDGNLNLSTALEGGGSASGYKYQYWVKKLVETDSGAAEVKTQYIWQLVDDGYGAQTAYVELIYQKDNETVDDTVAYLDEYGKFNVIVRIKEILAEEPLVLGDIIEELYTACTPDETGMPVITAVEVNGRVSEGDLIFVNGSALNITVTGKPANGYALYYGETELGSNSTGVFTNVMLNSSPLASGSHIVTAVMTGGNGTVKKDINLYVVGDYAAETPVITEVLFSQSGSTATFKMYVAYADGYPIKADNVTGWDTQGIVYTLSSGGVKLTSATPGVNVSPRTKDDDQGGKDLEYVEFTVNYTGYGIYQTVGTVSRVGKSAADDKVILWYSGYTRDASLVQTAKDGEGNSLAIDAKGYYVSVTGQPVTIEADGYIKDGGTDKAVKYAFYREDASGWILVQDYRTDGSDGAVMTWTPVRPGTYNIQARIRGIDMEGGIGTFEDWATKTYVIGNSSVADSITVEFYDYASGNLAEHYYAGSPYKIKAVYEGESDVLYMFTLYSKNLGTVYLNKFTTSCYYMFVPSRADVYTITARAISVDSYGYMDISYTHDPITVEFNKQLSAPAGYAFDDNSLGTVKWDAVAGAADYKVKVNESEYTVAGTSLNISTYLTAGENQISVSTKSKYGEYGTYSAALNVTAINDAAGLAGIIGTDKKYLLTSDINMGGGDKRNFISGTFAGVLDGNGKQIYNFDVAGSWATGFMQTVSGTVRNITAKIGTYTAGTQGGAFVGWLAAGGKVQKVHLKIGTIVHQATTHYAGTIVAYNNGGSITDCVVTSNWSAASTGLSNTFKVLVGQVGTVWSCNNNNVIINNAPDTIIKNYGIGTNFNGFYPLLSGDITELAVGEHSYITGIEPVYNLNFTSRDAEIATVDGSGKVTAVGAGTTYIDMTFGGITANGKAASFSISVTVFEPEQILAPENLQASSVNVNWDAVAGVQKYKVSVSSGTGEPVTFNDIAATSLNISSAFTGSGENTYTINVWSISSSGTPSANSADINHTVTLISDKNSFTPLFAATSKTKQYVLTADIDMGGFSAWYPASVANNILEATGMLDGNGHKVYNFLVGAAYNPGIFGVVKGVVKNISFICDKFLQPNGNGTGGVVAVNISDANYNGAVVDNVYVYVDKLVNRGLAGYWGGIARYNYGTVRNCVVSANWDTADTAYVSGNEAYYMGVIANVYNKGTYSNNALIINKVPATATNLALGANTVIKPEFAQPISLTIGGSLDLSTGYVIAGRSLTYAVEGAAATLSGNTLSGAEAGNAVLVISVTGISANGQTAFLRVPVTVTA